MTLLPHRSSRRKAAALVASLILLCSIVIGGAVFVIVQPLAATTFGDGDSRNGGAPSSEPASSGPVPATDINDPAIANLQPDLREALQRAAAAASAEDINLFVNSGWRSTEEQAELFEQAVVAYGSREEAARWVAPPELSTHVSGEAVDIGDFEASLWLGDRGSDFGLCRIYENERWHFEFRAEAIGGQCPELYLDASEDPRLQQ